MTACKLVYRAGCFKNLTEDAQLNDGGKHLRMQEARDKIKDLFTLTAGNAAGQQVATGPGLKAARGDRAIAPGQQAEPTAARRF